MFCGFLFSIIKLIGLVMIVGDSNKKGIEVSLSVWSSSMLEPEDCSGNVAVLLPQVQTYA